MITLILIYAGFGAITYWPAVYLWLDPEEFKNGKWYEWLAAWAVWTLTWPYRYIQDLVYWWRAKK